MRKLVSIFGSLSIVVGAIATFLIAPLAVSRNLRVAYGEIAASPNLFPAVLWGAIWALLSIVVTIAAAWLLASVEPPSNSLSRRLVGFGGCALLVGSVLASSLLASGTMSNAIADAGGSTTGAAELPAFVIVWVGFVSAVGGIIALALSAVHTRATSSSGSQTTAQR